MSVTLTGSGVQVRTTTCCNEQCGVTFAMDANFYRERLEDGRNFYCPNGHPQHFAESRQAQLDRAIRERNQARQERDVAQANERAERARANHEQKCRKAARTTLRKARERIAAGVCPCCTRTFQQLARHMKSKHPHYRTRV